MNNLLEIGKIVKSSGLKGKLKVLSYCESVETLETLKSVFIGRGCKDATTFRVKTSGVKRGSFCLELEGVETAESASELIGFGVFIPPEDLPKGDYYWKDIIGLDVVTEEGLRLGKITNIMATGSNDVYLCSGEREILIPAFDDIVRKIDIEKGIIVVKLAEGM